MDNSRNVLEALEALDPSRLTYEEWIETGMALKAEGYSCSVWDDWSSRDRDRYVPGDCEKRWQSFNNTGVGGGTIIHLAQTYANYTPVRALSWNDGLDAYYEEVLTVVAKPKEQPWQMAVRYLEALFLPDEKVSFVNQSVYKDKQDKWVPKNAGHVRKCSDLIADLKKYKTLNDVFGTINPEAGAWIRFNPTTGPNDKDVTRYAYSLVESDTLSIEEQKKLLINLKLPIACLVESGGKSVHAIVKIGAEDETEYKKRVAFLYDYLAKRGFLVDGANKNPARLSRLPGAQRKNQIQKLIATNVGCDTWTDWKDYIEGIDDDLPQMRSLWEQAKDPPELSPELISGVLREGCKMIITGESKAGKTCLSQNLAICIAEGQPWLGKFQCQQGKVLYINLEVEEASLFRRFKEMYASLKLKMSKTGGENIVPWNLRGYSAPMEKLAPKIIRRCRKTGPYKAIVIDPLYKVQQGDENSAEAIINFCNALDKIAHETGAAVIYDHHHPKGSSGSRKVIDRGSGSGVFARDADAICDISFLAITPDLMVRAQNKIEAGEKPMQIAFVLRDFKDVPPINMFFKFPIHYIDQEGILKGAAIEGSVEAGRQMSSNYSSEDTRKKLLDMTFDVCEKNGKAQISIIARQINKSAKQVKRWIDEFDEYSRNDAGEMWRNDE